MNYQNWHTSKSPNHQANHQPLGYLVNPTGLAQWIAKKGHMYPQVFCFGTNINIYKFYKFINKKHITNSLDSSVSSAASDAGFLFHMAASRALPLFCGVATIATTGLTCATTGSTGDCPSCPAVGTGKLRPHNFAILEWMPITEMNRTKPYGPLWPLEMWPWRKTRCGNISKIPNVHVISIDWHKYICIYINIYIIIWLFA